RGGVPRLDGQPPPPRRSGRRGGASRRGLNNRAARGDLPRPHVSASRWRMPHRPPDVARCPASAEPRHSWAAPLPPAGRGLALARGCLADGAAPPVPALEEPSSNGAAPSAPPPIPRSCRHLTAEYWWHRGRARRWPRQGLAPCALHGGELIGDPRNRGGPIAARRLPEQPQARVPGRILAVEKPTPIRNPRQ